MKSSSRYTEVTVRGLTVSVDYTAYKGHSGSLEEPPEEQYVEIEGIDINGVEMLQFLKEEFIVRVQEKVEEKAFRGDRYE